MAAHHLKITPAAVSKHIQTLENQLGVQLLHRSTRHLELTPTGLIYLDHANRILEAYSQSAAAISHSLEEPRGILRVACGPQFGYLHLIPHLTAFRRRYSELRLEIDFTQVMPDLEKEKIDVVMGLTTGMAQNYIRKTLVYSRWVLCASPKYLEAYGHPKKLSDLAKHEILTHVRRQPNNIMTFKNGETVCFEPSVYFNDTRAMRRAALHDAGIVMLHEYIIAEDIKDGRLVEILTKQMDQKKTIPLYIAYLQTPHMHQNIRAFIDFMTEVTKEGYIQGSNCD